MILKNKKVYVKKVKVFHLFVMLLCCPFFKERDQLTDDKKLFSFSCIYLYTKLFRVTSYMTSLTYKHIVPLLPTTSQLFFLLLNWNEHAKKPTRKTDGYDKRKRKEKRSRTQRPENKRQLARYVASPPLFLSHPFSLLSLSTIFLLGCSLFSPVNNNTHIHMCIHSHNTTLHYHIR